MIWINIYFFIIIDSCELYALGTIYVISLYWFINVAEPYMFYVLIGLPTLSFQELFDKVKIDLWYISQLSEVWSKEHCNYNIRINFFYFKNNLVSLICLFENDEVKKKSKDIKILNQVFYLIKYGPKSIVITN